MNKVILVTGTPGTGKTIIAKAIAKHYDYEYVHIGEHEEYVIAETSVKIVDVEKMISWLKRKQDESSKTLVIDSHLSHYFPSNRTRICIVLRCDPVELRLRLKKRGYPEAKININLEAEAMDLILQEAINEEHKIIEVDTTHKTNNITINKVIKAIDSEESSYGSIDYSNYLIKKLKKIVIK